MADLPASYETEVQLLRLSRELAMDLNDAETILKNLKITPLQWEGIQRDPRFLRLLEAEIAAWNAAGNTQERTKLKAAALIEEWLLEANQRIHDSEEKLEAKTEVVKLLARIAGISDRPDGDAGSGTRFSVTINLGADKQIKITKDAPPKTIEGSLLASADATDVL